MSLGETDTRRINARHQRILDLMRGGVEEMAAIAAVGYKSPKDTRRTLEKNSSYIRERDLIIAQHRAAAAVTRDDVIAGLKDAIDDAKLLSDPSAQIKGWSEIGKILGYYAPEQRLVTLSTEEETAKKQLESLPESELLALADISTIDVVDYEVMEDDDDA